MQLPCTRAHLPLPPLAESLHAFRHDLSPAWDLPVGGDLSGASLVLGPGGALYVTVAGRGLVKVRGGRVRGGREARGMG